MLPLEFMQRPAALVPCPRLHLIRFHGALAPNAKLRAAIAPKQALTSAFSLGILSPPCRYQHHQRQGKTVKMNYEITFNYLNGDPPSIPNASMNLTQGSWR